MSIWIVLDTDDEMMDVSAIYSTKALAERHTQELGGWFVEGFIRDTAHPDIDDPIKQEKRRVVHDKLQQEFRDYRVDQQRRAIQIANVLPHDRMGLCSCPTFSSAGRNFLNDHGYCSYCGKFEYTVFREYKGEGALQQEIDKLALWDREKMRRIVSGQPLLTRDHGSATGR